MGITRVKCERGTERRPMKDISVERIGRGNGGKGLMQ